ncbi:hypothetical protein DL546_000218 [Coniochaeta pulveracea]|nr:hypothetical protein DL546_000218 [Coniochaeta pulveracea]
MAAKTTITITYRRPGTQPPIFVAGEFSDPPWTPQEMDYTTDEDGEHTFKKDIEAYAGSSVQYKFRVGLGDWWVLNEDAPTATDSAGFLNNVAEVPAVTDTEPTNGVTGGNSHSSRVQHTQDTQDTKDTSIQGPDELQTESKPPVANAAKAVINPQEAQPTSGLDTPAIAETAAEVADSAALIDDDVDVPTHDKAPTIESTRELERAAEASSGPEIDIPVVAQTAAEVANTAALIDGDDIPAHEEAPTTKSAKESTKQELVRSASSTSASVTAGIADEVADTAEELDKNAPLPTHAEAPTAQSAKDAEKGAGPRSETGTNISTAAATADEVADTAAMLDKDSGGPEPETDSEPQVANAAKKLLNRAGPSSGSGTSTPSFVRTAAEVADSAALLDKEEPEEDVPDEEAGRTGFRRMSATPIPEVAATAAEVADTAQRLDGEPIRELELRPIEYDEDAIDEDGFSEPFAADSKAPLFAHECVGMELPEPDPLFEDQEDQTGGTYDDDIPSPSQGTEYDTDNIDLNDPTLERFPSNREEIIDTVRKLEGGLNEDQADVEGLVPASPIVGPSGPQNHDALVGGDLLLTSPVGASPVAGRGSRLLELPGRASLGSVSSDRLSAASLGSISEAEEEEAIDDDDGAPEPASLTPKPDRLLSNRTISPTSEEDEGVAFKVGEDKLPGSPRDATQPEVESGDSDPAIKTGSATPSRETRDTPASNGNPTTGLERASNHSNTHDVAPSAPSKNNKKAENNRNGRNDRKSQSQRSERADPSKRSAAANAWASAVQDKDAATNRELLAHRDAQNQELQAQGLTEADVQAPIKDTWRPTKLDDDGTRKNQNAQEQVYHATKATGSSSNSETPATPGKQQDPASNETPASPCFVAQVTGETGQASTGFQGSAGVADPAAKSTGVEAGPDSQLKKRRGGPERTGTPISIHDTGIKAAQGGNWFQSFFRIIFVDLIGGILNRLFGRKRET